MKSFPEIHKETAMKLGRPLEEREINFLKWLHERYKQEHKGSLRFLSES